jgi:hypothetical protein
MDVARALAAGCTREAQQDNPTRLCYDAALLSSLTERQQ